MASEFAPPTLSAREVSSDKPDSTGTKRRRRSTVRVACNACRTKKTRCDGRRPVCGWCASHPGVQCVYDTGSAEETRTAALKRENEILKRNLEHAERLLEDLKSLPDHESMNLLMRMRGAGNYRGSVEQTSKHRYAEPLSSEENSPTSDAMRNIQPMLDGVDLGIQSHFKSGSATTINRQTPHDVHNVASATFGPPGFSLVLKRPPTESNRLSAPVHQEPNGPPMGTLLGREGGGSFVSTT